MFEIDVFEVCWDLELDGGEDKPAYLGERISDLHKILTLSSKTSQTRIANHYAQAVTKTKYKERDHVLMWDKKLSTQDENKVARPWIGLYEVVGKLKNVRRLLKSEIENRSAWVHVNRLRKIDSGTVETGDPRDGVFPDSLRTFQKGTPCQVKKPVKMAKMNDVSKYRLVAEGRHNGQWNQIFQRWLSNFMIWNINARHLSKPWKVRNNHNCAAERQN